MELLRKLYDIISPKVKFRSSYFTLFRTNLLVQVLSIAPYPILSRLYTPEQFSTFALYNSIILFAAVFMTAKYDAAIVIAKNEDHAKHLLKISATIALLLTAFVLIIIVFFIEEIAGVTVPVEYLLTLPVVLFFAAFINIARNYLNRKSHYSAYSKSLLVQRVSSAGIAVISGFKLTGFNGLILGSITGFVVTGVIGMLTVYRDIVHSFKNNGAIRVASSYKDFPLFTMPLVLLNILNIQIPLYVFYHYFTKEIAGQYAMAYRILSIPEGVISASVAIVFYKSFSELSGKGQQSLNFVTAIWKKQFLIGVVPMLVLMNFGEEIITFILGEAWVQAGQILEVLVVLFFLQFISLPTSSAFTVLRKQQIAFLFSVVKLVLKLLVLIWGYMQQDILITIYMLLITEGIILVLFNSILYVIIHRTVKLQEAAPGE